MEGHQRLKDTMGCICGGSKPTHRWQVDYIGPLPMCPEAYWGAFTGIDIYSEFGFAFPVIVENVLNIIKIKLSHLGPPV